ncbi:hypothetical protein ACTFIZ_009731 [Dictyostelium cf. discoideum]
METDTNFQNNLTINNPIFKKELNYNIIEIFNNSKVLELFNEINESLNNCCEISKNLQLKTHVPLKNISLIDSKTIINKINKTYSEIKILLEHTKQINTNNNNNNNNNNLILKLNEEIYNKIIKIESFSNELCEFLYGISNLSMVEIIHFEDNKKNRELYIGKKLEFKKYEKPIQEILNNIEICEDFINSNDEKYKLIMFLEISIKKSKIVYSHFNEIKVNWLNYFKL